MLSQPSTYLKAIVATLLAVLTGLGTVLVGDMDFGEITTGQWVAVATGAVLAFAGTFGVENKPMPAPGG